MLYSYSNFFNFLQCLVIVAIVVALCTASSICGLNHNKSFLTASKLISLKPIEAFFAEYF